MDDIHLKNSVKLRLYAAARSAAGRSEIVGDPGSLDVILISAAEGNPRLAQIFLQSSFLLDGIAIHNTASEIPPGSTLDVLPPFAGG